MNLHLNTIKTEHTQELTNKDNNENVSEKRNSLDNTTKNTDTIFNNVFKLVAKGADKKVWRPDNQLGAADPNADKAFYTPNKAFGFSRLKNLKAEFKKVQNIKVALNGNIRCLAVDGKRLKGANKIKGQFTLIVKAAVRDLEKQINSITGRGVNDTPVTMSERITLMRDMLTGLKDLHEAGYIHGDLKPENCLIVEEKVPKGKKNEAGVQNEVIENHLQIADFGRAAAVKDGESVEYKGNSRFAPPEGRASKEGEGYSSGLMMIRAFEEGLDGDYAIDEHPIIEVADKDKDCKAHECRRGVDKLILEHKAFPTCENKDTFIGRIKNARRRNNLDKTSTKDKKAQNDVLNDYIDKLCDRLVTNGKIAPNQKDDLKQLLKQMVSTNPNERPTTEEALNRYNAIFPEGESSVPVANQPKNTDQSAERINPSKAEQVNPNGPRTLMAQITNASLAARMNPSLNPNNNE